MSANIQSDGNGGQVPTKRTAPAPARMQAILAELDRVAAEYTACRSARDAANVRFEAARDHFAAVKRIATNILGGSEWWGWALRNRDVLYAGMTMGDAIRAALNNHSIERAVDSRGNRAAYDPAMTMDELYQALEDGGLEFASNAPRREVNAALMKLDGVTKLDDGRYEIGDAAETFSLCYPDQGDD